MLSYVNRVAFELFGLSVYWYAIIIVSGVILAIFLSSREAQRVGM
ncbi:MAG: prolipoprotein diacylglyceryl transferase family protein, partial [Enterococcus italicus]